MAGLGGLILTYVFVLIAAFVFIVIGAYNLVASVTNWKLIWASSSALGTMLVLAALIYIDDYGWVDVPGKWFDVMGFVWPVLSVVVAVFVYNSV